jgi:DNA-binding NarL/FixJ family response regulator
MIVTDHPIMRDGLRLRVQQESDMYVVCEACDLPQTLRDFPPCRPDVVVIDLQRPSGAGLRAMNALRKLSPGMPLVVLESDSGIARHGSSVPEEGATVMVSKIWASEQVIPAIRRAAAHARSSGSR